MSQETIQKFKCVNDHIWASKDTGICPECYTNIYELKEVADMKQDDDFQQVLGLISGLKEKYHLPRFDVIQAIEDETEY